MTDYEKQQAAVIEARFPGWEAWVSLHGQWRVRLRHSSPPVMLFDNSPEELCQQIARWIAEHP